MSAVIYWTPQTNMVYTEKEEISVRTALLIVV